jgi:hypothetical protein
MIIADDAATAGRELESALERVSQRVVGEQLCVLDNSIGLSVSRLVLKKFQFLAATKIDKSDDESETESVFVQPSHPLTLAASVSAEVINVE